MRNPVFQFAGVTVQVWHLVAVALFVIAVVLIAIAIAIGKRAHPQKYSEEDSVAPVRSRAFDDEPVRDENSRQDDDSAKPNKEENMKKAEPAKKSATTADKKAPAKAAKAEEKTVAKTATKKVEPEKAAETKKTAKAEPAKTENKKAAPAKAEETKKSTAKPAKAEEPKKSATKPAEVKKTAPKKEVAVEEVEDDDFAENDEVDEGQTEAKVAQGPKIYHIALRKDNRWQVKLGKGSKALKLFNTQKEAIDFAKEKAKNQEGHILIHKVNGQIRKTRY